MYVLNYIFLFYLMLQAVFGVDDDYYLNSALRSSTLTCKNRVQQIDCQIKCGLKAAFCIGGDCYCLTLALPEGDLESQHHIDVVKPHETLDEDMNYENSNSDELHMISIAKPDAMASLYANRPALRHHIAHFCPNLDVARECIKKCMVVGKPAFCGKDHVCYCGHAYSNNDDDTTIDVKEQYGQFKDLYAKYFGTDRDTVESDM